MRVKITRPTHILVEPCEVEVSKAEAERLFSLGIAELCKTEVEIPEVKMVLDCGADSCELDEGNSCDLECMTPVIKRHIDYYDDEELDAYKGKSSDQYTDEEAEEFRNVFYTMQEEDVPGWVKSLQQRELEIPDSLKDEVLLVLREIRKKGKYGNNQN